VPFTVDTAGVEPVVKFNIIYGVGLNLRRESPVYKLILLGVNYLKVYLFQPSI